jgi:mannose-6-phosphate isomerase-like protein (cupin superfamily)
MSDYTLVNLKEVEDQAPKFGYAPHLQSRFARRALGLENSGISHFTLAPGFRVPFGHHHADQEEVYVVVAGSARMKLDDELVELGTWDAVRVPPDMTRGMEGGPEGAEILAFGAPSNENADAKMVREFWPREQAPARP